MNHSSDGFTPAELRKLRSLKDPHGIQRFLDAQPYHLADTAWSPRRVLRENTSHCYEGALFAAAALRVNGYPPLVIDLFAGSANTLYWIRRQVGACRAVGFELDDAVFELARANLSVVSRGIDLAHDSYERGLRALGEPDEDLIIVFVAPPWGRALSEGSGLDLRRTEPPVAEVIDVTTAALGQRKLLFAVQVYEAVEPGSLAEVTTRLSWSAMKVYDINAPGQNHGLLLAGYGVPGGYDS